MNRHRITREKAKAYYAQLCEHFNGSPTHTNSCIISFELMAEVLKMTVEEAESIFWDMVHYGITERQGGGVVI